MTYSLTFALVFFFAPMFSASTVETEVPTRSASFYETAAGEWEGEGELFGSAADFRMTWKLELGGKFATLAYSIGGPVEMQAVAHYQTGKTTAAGVWVDSRGQILQLATTVGDRTLETIWRSPTETGRTEYELTSEDSMSVRDYYSDDGDWTRFGQATYSRIRNTTP